MHYEMTVCVHFFVDDTIFYLRVHGSCSANSLLTFSVLMLLLSDSEYRMPVPFELTFGLKKQTI